MKELIDEAFYIEESSWGTWKSFDKNEKPLVTSFGKEQCIEATRFYCKGLQEGFTDDLKSYNSIVGGKL